MKKFLNKNFYDLDLIADKFAAKYKNESPFPHIVFDNFFNEVILENILKEFPKNLKDVGKVIDHDPEQKLVNRDNSQLSQNILDLLNATNSEVFINFLNKLSGVERHLIPDPYHWGGGTHELRDKGYLNIHSDFNKHPKMELDRRINVLIYLNHNWQEEYGGSLELWDKEMKKCQKKIVPIFNRVVIFNTNDFSFHGNPDPINCPDKSKTRKSIALYYYTNGRPGSEVSDEDHSTLFKNRPSTKDSNKMTYYKKIFWKFYIKKKRSLKGYM